MKQHRESPGAIETDSSLEEGFSFKLQMLIKFCSLHSTLPIGETEQHFEEQATS